MSSVRERLEIQAGQNRGLGTDHSKDSFGSLVVTNKVENAKEVSYLVQCAVCGTSGQRVTQKQLEDPKFVVKCANVGCGKKSAPRSYDAAVYEQMKPEARISQRDRAEAAAREAEIKAFENNGGQDATN
jgi:hypothetical protein